MVIIWSLLLTVSHLDFAAEWFSDLHCISNPNKTFIVPCVCIHSELWGEVRWTHLPELLCQVELSQSKHCAAFRTLQNSGFLLEPGQPFCYGFFSSYFLALLLSSNYHLFFLILTLLICRITWKKCLPLKKKCLIMFICIFFLLSCRKSSKKSFI